MLATRSRPLCNLFRVQAGAEEVEEDFQDCQGGYGEYDPEEPRYLPAGDHAEEDQDRRHVERVPLYPRLQHVALDLLDYQVEQGRQDRLGWGDGEGDYDRRYGAEPRPEVGDDRRDRDPGAEQERVGDPEQEQPDGRDGALYDHVQPQSAQVA